MREKGRMEINGSITGIDCAHACSLHRNSLVHSSPSQLRPLQYLTWTVCRLICHKMYQAQKMKLLLSSLSLLPGCLSLLIYKESNNLSGWVGVNLPRSSAVCFRSKKIQINSVLSFHFVSFQTDRRCLLVEKLITPDYFI